MDDPVERVTQQRDMLARIIGLRTQRGTHLSDVALIDGQVAQLIRQLLGAAYSPTRLAADIGMSRTRIYQIAAKAQ